MAAFNTFTMHKGLLEEIENVDDPDELKRICGTLINENQNLCQKSNAAFRSLDKQNQLIQFLQDNLHRTMSQNSQVVRLIYKIWGKESMRNLDSMMGYHAIINYLVENNCFKGKDKETLNMMFNAIKGVKMENMQLSRDKFESFIAMLDDLKVPKDNVKEKEYVKDDIDVKEGGKSKKEDIKENDVKVFDLEHMGCLFETFNKDMAECKLRQKKRKSKKKSKCVKFLNLEAISEDVKDYENLKTKAKGLKKKSKMFNKSHEAESKSSEKIRCNSSSITEATDIKDLKVKLIDFMQDNSANNDPDISKFMQAFLKVSKINEELEAVDVESDHKTSDSFDKSDDDENLILFNSPEPRDNLDEDSILSKGTIDLSCEEGISYKEDPSISDIYIPDFVTDFMDISEIFRRGPRTPSLSPPAHKE